MIKALKSSFYDRNGKVSSKRLWAGITMANGLLITNVNVAMKVLIAFGIVCPENIYKIEVSLILGILGVGAGLFASSVAEKQNQLQT